MACKANQSSPSQWLCSALSQSPACHLPQSKPKPTNCNPAPHVRTQWYPGRPAKEKKSKCQTPKPRNLLYFFRVRTETLLLSSEPALKPLDVKAGAPIKSKVSLMRLRPETITTCSRQHVSILRLSRYSGRLCRYRIQLASWPNTALTFDTH